MNSFAKYLFQGMFSWVRDAVQQLSDPALIDSWLATHWLAALIPILLIATAVDFLVWIARWKPYLVWRSSLNRSMSLLSEEGRELRRFRKGFSKESAEIGEVARPLTEAPVSERVYAEAAPKQDPGEDAYYDWQFAEPAAQPQEQTPQRHRRSDRYRRPLRKVRDVPRRSIMQADDTPLDGLPPIVSKEEAFRAPVYPRRDQDTQS